MALTRLLSLLLLAFCVHGCDKMSDSRGNAALAKQVAALRQTTTTLSNELRETSKKVTHMQEADQRLSRAFFDLSIQIAALRGVREPILPDPTPLLATTTAPGSRAPTFTRSFNANTVAKFTPSPPPNSKVPARVTRRSTGHISCGDIWRMIDQGKSRRVAARALHTTLAVVNDCEEEPRRKGQWKTR